MLVHCNVSVSFCLQTSIHTFLSGLNGAFSLRIQLCVFGQSSRYVDRDLTIFVDHREFRNSHW